MQLFYSGAADFKLYQPQPSKSLGGYISNSPVLNAQVGALFSSLTRDPMSHSECKMIVLDNNLTSDVDHINIWMESASPYVKYTIDAVLPAVDKKGKPIFEQITQPTQIPYQANLAEHGIDNPIEAGALQKCKLIGLWIRRELTAEGNSYIDKLLKGEVLSCEELEEAYNENEQIPNEIIDDAVLKISFDIVNPSTTTTTTVAPTTTTTTVPIPQIYALPMFETIENQTSYTFDDLWGAELISLIIETNPMNIGVDVTLIGGTITIPSGYGAGQRVFVVYKSFAQAAPPVYPGLLAESYEFFTDIPTSGPEAFITVLHDNSIEGNNEESQFIRQNNQLFYVVTTKQ